MPSSRRARLALCLLLGGCGARSGLPGAEEVGAGGAGGALSGGAAAGGGGGAAGTLGGTSGVGAGGAAMGGSGAAAGRAEAAGAGGSGGASGIGGQGGQAEEPSSVVGLALGTVHTCALLDTGDVRCWGAGASGRLGYGNEETIGDDEVPAVAGNVELGGVAVQIAAGGADSCALLATGNVRCWGYGLGGELGYGNTASIGDDETPASAGDVNVGGRVTALSSGAHHTCALLADATVRCWGSGTSGQLGYGDLESIGDDEEPASARDVHVGGPVTQVAAGGMHTCALLTTGSVRCWGSARTGALGYGNKVDIGDDETPESAGDVAVGGRVMQLAAGVNHTCALLVGGAVRCWGLGAVGALGYGNTHNIGDDETPASAGDVELGGTAVQLVAGDSFTCALLAGGGVRCWGLGAYGELGYGSTANIGDDESPTSVGEVDVGGPVVLLASGVVSVCALLRSGDVRCWGLGQHGRLGYANEETIGDDESPASTGSVRIF